MRNGFSCSPSLEPALGSAESVEEMVSGINNFNRIKGERFQKRAKSRRAFNIPRDNKLSKSARDTNPHKKVRDCAADRDRPRHQGATDCGIVGGSVDHSGLLGARIPSRQVESASFAA